MPGRRPHTPEQQLASATARLLKHRRVVPHPDLTDTDPSGSEASCCWVCTLTTTNAGYATIRHAGRNLNAHRLAYEIWRGPIPAGMCVCHRCDVRTCVNPDHLYLATHRGNMSDMVHKGRSFRGRRHRGVPRVLTPDGVRMIRQAVADGTHSLRALGRMFGVHPATIRQAALGRTFRDVV